MTRVAFAANATPRQGASLVVSGYASRGVLIVQQQQPSARKAPAAAAAKVSLEGTLKLLHADYFAGGTSRFIWELEQDGGEPAKSTSRSRRPTCTRACASCVNGMRSGTTIAPDSITALTQAPAGNAGPVAAAQNSTALVILLAFQPTPPNQGIYTPFWGQAWIQGGHVHRLEQRGGLLVGFVVRPADAHGQRHAVAHRELSDAGDVRLHGHRDRSKAGGAARGLRRGELSEVRLCVHQCAGVRLGGAGRSARHAGVEQRIQHARRDRARGRPHVRAGTRQFASVQRRDDRHQLPARAAGVRRPVGHHGQPEHGSGQRLAEERDGLGSRCEGRQASGRHGVVHAVAAQLSRGHALRRAGARRRAPDLLDRIPAAGGLRCRVAGVRDQWRDHPSRRPHAPAGPQRIRMLGHVFPRHGAGDGDDVRRRACRIQGFRRLADRRDDHRRLEGRQAD